MGEQETTPQIGWRVVDKDGNVLQSGGVSFAEAAGDLADALKALGRNQKKENG